MLCASLNTISERGASLTLYVVGVVGALYAFMLGLCGPTLVSAVALVLLGVWGARRPL